MNIKTLLPELRKLVGELAEDLLVRSTSDANIDAGLREAFQQIEKGGRTAQAFEVWRTDYLEQVAVAWVLACVFVRFMEDNGLIDECRLAGEGERRRLAEDSHELYFRDHPHDTDREYFQHVFKDVGRIPAAKDLFAPGKTPLWAVAPSGDAAMKLLKFWRERDDDKSGKLKRTFNHEDRNSEDENCEDGNHETHERHERKSRRNNRVKEQGQGISSSDSSSYSNLANSFFRVARVFRGSSSGGSSSGGSDPTRFLGDLYQDLSENAKKKYALLQTPVFVEEFILDRTLTPAVAEFGLEKVRMIDPTCGSGHFLLGGFARLFDLWSKPDHTTGNAKKDAQKALDGIYGVDLNPFAVAIARFRLIVAALQACGIKSLKHAPEWHLHLAGGDSLLYREGRDRYERTLFDYNPIYDFEDPPALKAILHQKYHVVVGNPPYITVKDKAQNEAYRELYTTCHRQYSLGVPFTERFWDLAIQDEGPRKTPKTRKIHQNIGREKNDVGERDQPVGDRTSLTSSDSSDSSFRAVGVFRGSGYVGMITANSFMKREFGKKLIEAFFPNIDLTHVVDTSGAYIPGHGTPTVILFGRPRNPVGRTVRAVLGIRGEPKTPDDPAQGLVWQSILRQIDQANAEDGFTSTADVPRETFAKHPWSIGGGGAGDLQSAIEGIATSLLGEHVIALGRVAHTGNDEAYVAEHHALSRMNIPPQQISIFVEGERLRDWMLSEPTSTLFPYHDLKPLQEGSVQTVFRWLWPYRDQLWNRREPNGAHWEIGKTWYEFSRFHPERYVGIAIAFAFVATHNHFVLDRGGKVFNRSAPIIKLPAEAGEDDHFALLGLLNSSTACFWMQQTFHNKGGPGGGCSKDEKWHDFYEFSGTGLQKLPIPEEKPLSLARLLDELAGELEATTAEQVLEKWRPGENLERLLEEAETKTEQLRSRMIALQEELDWQCYELYGLEPRNTRSTRKDGEDEEPFFYEDLFRAIREFRGLSLGERAFEIVLARQMKRGELETKWFERHGSTPITELPSHWPAAYRKLVERRIGLIETNKEIGLIEKPEYKRRWNTEPWTEQQQRALRQWLLARLEEPKYRKGTRDHPEFTTTARMADAAETDAELREVATVYRGRPDFDMTLLVAELVEAEAVPFLPVLRYKATGLRKREVWERTWALQREEDREGTTKDNKEGTTKDTNHTKEDTIIETENQMRNPNEGKKFGSGSEPSSDSDSSFRAFRVFRGSIPVPPKYTSADFVKPDYWRLRGKLDVPKERWVSYPHCSTDSDRALVVGWAGWNHLEQATALTAYYDARKRDGWDADRLMPLLAGLDQLLPWIHQWHPEVDAEFGETAGQSFQTMLEHDAHELGLTLEEIRKWTPSKMEPRTPRTTRKKKDEAEESS